MATIDYHHTPATVEWETPQALFDSLDVEFGPFTLDVCASAANTKCVRYFTAADNGLEQDWHGERCWMNPPYGREIGKWVRKAATSGTLVVALLPVRTDTAWWQDWVIPYASGIRYLRGRVRFGGKGPAPFPSAAVVYRR